MTSRRSGPSSFPIGARGGVVLSLLAAAVIAYAALDLSPAQLVPNAGGLDVAKRFFARALAPAWTSEAEFVPPGSPPLLVGALEAAWRTVLFAAAAMSVSLLLGVGLGFFASTGWWPADPVGAEGAIARSVRRALLPAVYGVTRVVITMMRSIHELLWAVLFVSAFGLTEAAALAAIALPYGGTLAKIFSEMIDEAPRDSALYLRGSGAAGPQVFAYALVPRALPDLTAYSFYRFECAIRSAAILGFFGFPTLGLYIRQSFRATNYGEVWTYLYVLIFLVVLFDAWSGAVRRRLVVR